MAVASLIPLTIQAPGKKGLNSQSSSTSLDTGWATELENVVFDFTGRITSRKGITKITTASTLGAISLEQVFCYEGFNAGVPVTGVVSTGNKKFYTGTTALTDITGSITAPTANNWQFMNFRTNKVIACQQGHTPIVATIVAGVLGNFADLAAASGTLPTGNCGIAAFGRIWILDSDNTTIKYSALLDETKWAAVDGGGSIDTTLYWPKGRDYVVALAAWEDKLIVFGRHSILIYNYPGTPAALDLTDTIPGTGCIARDSVQAIGVDMLFLSESGVRSLKKTIITGKTPVEEVSLAVRDVMMPFFTGGSDNSIRSCYNQIEGFYLLTLVGTTNTTYMFDLKNYIQESSDPTVSSIRISSWTGFPIHAIAYGRNGVMYLTYQESGNESIGSYGGYYDSGTTQYSIKYTSPWIDLADPEGGESGTFFKILKSLTIQTLGSSAYTINVAAYFDFVLDIYSDYA